MNTSLAQLSNSALLDQLQRLAQCEREATATLVAHLAEVKKRKLYLAEGYGSMFQYCTQVLHLSEHATYLRLEAARMTLRFPEILAALGSGDLNLTAIRLLAPYLTSENLDELLAAVRHRTRVEIECFLARRFPRPDVPVVVRKLPVKQAGAVGVAMQIGTPASASAGTTDLGVPAPATTPADSVTTGLSIAVQAAPRSVVEPLAPERYKVQFTASAATHAKLQRARDLLRHRIPNGDLSEIFDPALAALVEKVEKEKLAATDRPRPGRGTAAHSRTIPAQVKRAVWQRDGGQCVFVGKAGHRCAETGFLEFHHVVPFARGGAATPANIQLRCRAHNQFEASLEFGSREAFVRESGAAWTGEIMRASGAAWTGDIVRDSGAAWNVAVMHSARAGIEGVAV